MSQLAPLYSVAGAPGSGKTTALRYLIEHADGVVVMDMDELLEDGRLLGVLIADSCAAASWPAYDRMWERIITMVRRAGHPVLLLCPIPDEDAFASGHGFGLTEPVHWLHLDCSDEARRARLQARGWSTEQIVAAAIDAINARRFMPDTIDTTSRAPAEVARAILAWARSSAAHQPPNVEE